MSNNIHHDVTSLRIHVNELKSVFDRAMCEGDTFEQVKEIYMQIKELEYEIKVLEWSAIQTCSLERRIWQ